MVSGEPVIVLNDGGTIRAFSGVCTHEACELGWNPDQQLIRCPCHGSAFDVRGRVAHGPAVEPLPAFATAVAGNRVYVGEVLPAPAASPGRDPTPR
jgi:Rieske Fe-S protein